MADRMKILSVLKSNNKRGVKMKIIKLYQPHEDSNTFNKEALFEKEFVTPREQRMKIKFLVNNNEDVEIETLNDYVVGCILANCVDNENVELKVFKEDLIMEEYIEIETDQYLYWNDDEVYPNMKDVVQVISDKRINMLERGK